MSSHSWTAFAFIVFSCFSFVLSSETKLRFISIPVAKQKISISSNLTINCSTNDANATTAVYYKRKPAQKIWILLKPGVDQIVQAKQQVYTLINAERKHRGQYQCRSWKGKNGAVISWPPHVGKVIVTKDKGKSEQGKISGSKKPVVVKSKLKRPSKKNEKKKRRPHKKTGNKRHRKKRPGKKKKGKKRKGGKNSKKGGKKSGKKKTPSKNKKGKVDHKKKILKYSITLKTPKKQINAIVGRTLYIKCVAKFYPPKPQPIFTIMWYKDDKLIGQPFPSHLTITSKTKSQKRKVISLLKLKTFQAADKGKYVCKAMYPNGHVANSLTVQVTSKS